MKTKINLPILLAIILMSVAACTPNEGNQGNSEPFSPTISDITETTWLWERFDDTAGLNDITVDDPSLYTFILKSDGTYSIKADCNLSSGNFILDESSISFEAGPTTLAECGPDSLYHTFLTQMSNVATYVIDGDKLVLNLWADGGNMVFIQAE